MHEPRVNEPDRADIEMLAYRLWIESGRVRGRDREHWQIARQMLIRKSLAAAGQMRSRPPEAAHTPGDNP